jgi:hypothetical protein
MLLMCVDYASLGAALGTLYAGYLTAVEGVSSRWPWITLLAIVGNLSYLGTSLHFSGQLLPSIEDPSSNNGHVYNHDDEEDVTDIE